MAPPVDMKETLPGGSAAMGSHETQILTIRPKTGSAEGASDSSSVKTRLQLLDLPDDVLREIVKQVSLASIQRREFTD